MGESRRQQRLSTDLPPPRQSSTLPRSGPKAHNCSSGQDARAPRKGTTCLVGPERSLASLNPHFPGPEPLSKFANRTVLPSYECRPTPTPPAVAAIPAPDGANPAATPRGDRWTRPRSTRCAPCWVSARAPATSSSSTCTSSRIAGTASPPRTSPRSPTRCACRWPRSTRPRRSCARLGRRSRWWAVGTSAPAGRRTGHVGGIIAAGRGSAPEKLEALREAGMTVPESPAEMARTMARVLREP